MSAPQPLNDAEEVKRLAALSPLEYDRQRQATAEALGVSVGALDKAVRAEQRRMMEAASEDFLADDELWPEPVDGGELLDEMRAILNRYLVLPDGADVALATWALFTYVHDAVAVSPMLMLTSPEKGCGKTTTLDVLLAMVHLPLPASNVSAAAMFRAISKWRPTMLVDEADTHLPQNDELRGVLNSGHTRASAFVLRCDGDQNEPKRFSTWCPKVIAGIGKQRDTLEDRSIVIQLRRKLPDEHVQRFRNDRAAFADVRSKCARWAEDSREAVHRAEPALPDFLHNRQADNWEPLLAIADLCGWGDKVREAARVLADAKEDDSVNVRLLADIRDVFRETGADRLQSERLCELLTAIEDAPWGEWNRGRPMTPRQLAAKLKPFGIRARVMRIGGKTPRGYARDDFADAFLRYLPPSLSATAQHLNKNKHLRENLSATQGGDVAHRKSRKSLKNKECCAVADKGKEEPEKKAENAPVANNGGQLDWLAGGCDGQAEEGGRDAIAF